MSSVFIKDPDSVLDYKFDWRGITNGAAGASSDWLAQGETISSFTIATASGLTEDSSSKTDAETSVIVWLSGGVTGNDYNVSCRVITSDGRTDERTITVSVINR